MESRKQKELTQMRKVVEGMSSMETKRKFVLSVENRLKPSFSTQQDVSDR
jgi:hypothetical protein